MAGTPMYEGGDPHFGISPTYIGDATGEVNITTGGSGGNTGSVGELSIEPKLYDPIPIPDLPPQPTPSFIDDARVSQLTQQYASPAIRSARNALREALTGRYSNPIQQKFKARGALEGFGGAVERGVASGRPGAISVAQREAEAAGENNRRAYDLAWQRSLLDYNQKVNLQNMKIKEAQAQKALEASMPTGPAGGGGGGNAPIYQSDGQGNAPRFQGRRGSPSFYGGGDSETPFGTTEWQRQNLAQANLLLENYARDNSGPWIYVEGERGTSDPGRWVRSGGIHPRTLERWVNEGRILGEYPQTGVSRNNEVNRVGYSNVTTGNYPSTRQESLSDNLLPIPGYPDFRQEDEDMALFNQGGFSNSSGTQSFDEFMADNYYNTGQ